MMRHVSIVNEGRHCFVCSTKWIKWLFLQTLIYIMLGVCYVNDVIVCNG